MFGIGTQELIIILVIVLLVFGSKKLPELAQGLGKGIKEFRKATTDIQDELDINKPYEQAAAKKSVDADAKNSDQEKKSEEDNESTTKD
jgi:TatA/E family protein of Tat protein translocase